MCSDKLKKKFVIVSHSRSGSTFLQHHLKRVSHVICLGEIYYISEKTSLLRRFFLKFFPSVVLNDAITKHFNNKKNKSIFGFKILFKQQQDILKVLLKSKDWHKIILTRRNFIKHYVSKKIAQQTNTRVIASAEARKKYQEKNTRVYIDPKKLLSFHRDTKKLTKKAIDLIEKNNQKYLVVEYSDFLGDKRNKTLDKIHNYLGIEESASTVKNPVQKMNSNNLKDLISNYDELREYLGLYMPEAVGLLEDTIS